MKNIALFCLFFTFSTLPAWEAWFEGKGAYCYPTNDKFRKIYGEGGIFGAEVTVSSCNRYALWASVDRFWKSGHSIGLETPTCISLTPVGFGAKALCQIPRFRCGQLYAGLGVQYLFLKVHNESCFVTRDVQRSGAGWIAKGGAVFDLPCDWFLDLFVDYHGKSFDFCRGVTGRASFVSVGGGIGCKLIWR